MHAAGPPITDFHTHAFPDAIAEYAMEQLSDTDGMNACHDGTLDGLRASMASCGIERAVLCNIATKPDHFQNILNWCRAVRSDRIVPLPSVHPEDPHFAERLQEIAEEGFPGIKIHPYYQGFVLDDPQLIPFFRELERFKLLVISHTGFDAAFPDRKRIADPARILALLQRHPDLRFIATHFGAWEDWDEVERLLIGQHVAIEISFAFGRIPDERIRTMLQNHPREYILFGTDSPWTDQKASLESLYSLGMGQAFEDAVLRDNAERLLRGKE